MKITVESLGLKKFDDPVIPSLLLRSAHAQTLYGYYRHLRTPLIFGGERVQIPLSDGDALDALLLERPNPQGVVALFHGLGGTNQSSYMLRVGRALVDSNWTVLLVNHRGCGKGIDLPCRAPYHSGRGDDVGEVTQWCRDRYPNTFQAIVGFSLGGSAVLNLMSERRGNCWPDFAIAVNAPLDVKDSAYSMLKGMNRIYSSVFKEDCYQGLVQRKKRGWIESIPSRKNIRSIVDLDVHYTAPATGHKNVDDFYAYCSSGPDLHKVKVPTLLITAKDDPISKFEHYERFSKSSAVALHAEAFGGHIGYLAEQQKGPKDSWLERAVQHYLSEARRRL